MNNNESRQKIVDAAINEFSEKGFDGSRVEDIAKRAGVSKALIYYNFASKEAILVEILDGIVSSLGEHLTSTYLNSIDSTKSEHATKAEFIASLNYVLEKRKEMTILVMQSLGTTSNNKRMLNLWNEVNLKVRANVLAQLGYKSERLEESTQRLIDYFLIFVPYVMYAVLGADWIRENGLTVEMANEAMSKIYLNIYDWLWE